MPTVFSDGRACNWILLYSVKLKSGCPSKIGVNTTQVGAALPGDLYLAIECIEGRDARYSSEQLWREGGFDTSGEPSDSIVGP